MDWNEFYCPVCTSVVYYPVRGESKALVVRCMRCRTDVDLNHVHVAPASVMPPAAVQIAAMMDDVPAPPPPPRPAHLQRAHPSLLRMMSRFQPVLGRLASPVQDWVLAVAEEPDVVGCVRVFKTLLAHKRASAWGWTWSIRRRVVGPLLPLYVAPDSLFATIPIALTVLGVLAMLFLEATAYERQFEFAAVLAACRLIAVCGAFVSIALIFRIATVNPGYLHPPQFSKEDPEPEDKSAIALRRAGRCPQCFVKRSPNTGHCKICNMCVERIDHHCNVLGQCIGRHNFGCFVWYCFCITFALTAAIGWLASLVGVWPVDPDAPTWTPTRRAWPLALARVFVMVFVVVLFGAAVIFTSAMSMGAAASLTTGRTGRQKRIRKRRAWLLQQRMESGEYRDLNPNSPAQEALAAARDLECDESDIELGDDGRGCVGRWRSELCGGGGGIATASAQQQQQHRASPA